MAKVLAGRSLAWYFLIVIETDIDNNSSRSITSRLLLCFVAVAPPSLIDYIRGDTAPLRPQRLIVMVVPLLMMVVLIMMASGAGGDEDL